MKCSVLSPQALFFQGEVDQVILPAQEGEITILPHHAPLITLLKDGWIILKKGHQVLLEQKILGGYAHITPQETKILVEEETFQQ